MYGRVNLNFPDTRKKNIYIYNFLSQSNITYVKRLSSKKTEEEEILDIPFKNPIVQGNSLFRKSWSGGLTVFVDFKPTAHSRQVVL